MSLFIIGDLLETKLQELLAEGESNYDTGKFEEAVKIFNKVISLFPSNIEAYFYRGSSYMALNMYDMAIEDYSKVIDLDLDHYKAYLNRGITYSEKGELDKAIEDYSKVIDLDSDHYKAYLIRGITYSEKGELDKAIEDYDYVITNFDGNIVINTSLFKARALIELNKSKDATIICDSLKVRTDLEEQAYSELMNLYSKLKDFPSVKQIFEKSSKSVQLYETYTKILEINAEPNLEEKQRMQSELDKALEDNRQKQQTIESLEIKIKEKDQKIKEKDQIIYEEIKGLRNDIRDHDKKQDIYAKESEERDGITHRKLDSISEILTFMNEDISKIKQNGEKTLAGIHDLDQKMDKLSEISDKIYEEAKKASQELIQENLEKFNEKKKELMDRFEIKYSEN